MPIIIVSAQPPKPALLSVFSLLAVQETLEDQTEVCSNKAALFPGHLENCQNPQWLAINISSLCKKNYEISMHQLITSSPLTPKIREHGTIQGIQQHAQIIICKVFPVQNRIVYPIITFTFNNWTSLVSSNTFICLYIPQVLPLTN